MGIDWVTFIAQIVNLFVLVWLLKRFLYRPILNAVDKRQTEIMAKVNKAREEHEAAQIEHKKVVAAKVSFETEKQNLFDEALKEATSYKSAQIDEIKKEVQLLKQKMQRDLDKEKEALALQVRTFLADKFMALSTKIMTDLSGTTILNENILLLENRLKSLSKSEIEKINKILKKQKDIYITSSVDLSDKDQKELLSFFNKFFNIKEDILAHFKTDSTLILGIEMTVGDFAIEWNLKSYLDEYQTNLNTLLSGLITEE